MNLKRLKLNRQTAFTLIELLLVLLIIGVLSGVTLRAIDLTRERTMYTDTAKKLNDITKAIIGDPDLISDGRRVDFGFVGDLGRLPLDLDELVKNTQYSNSWNGPYIKRTFLEDTANPSYKLDAWGNDMQYSPVTGLISSRGNGQIPMTRSLADSLSFILNNRVSGTITDVDNNPPGKYDTLIDVIINLPNNITRDTNPNRSGYFQFNDVPIGKHQIKVVMNIGASPSDTLVKWVYVVPKSNTPIDFKFTRTFRSSLQVLKPVYTFPNNPYSVWFRVFNNSLDTVSLDNLKFIKIQKADTTAYCFGITRETYPNKLWPSIPLPDDSAGIGRGEIASFDPTISVKIGPEGYETFNLLNFHLLKDSTVSPPINMKKFMFDILFSDGSLISFTTESLPSQ